MRIRCWNFHLEEMLEARVHHLEGILKRKRSSPSTGGKGTNLKTYYSVKTPTLVFTY